MVTIDKNYFDLKSKDFSFDWFEQHDMGYVKEIAMQKYQEIIGKGDKI